MMAARGNPQARSGTRSSPNLRARVSEVSEKLLAWFPHGVGLRGHTEFQQQAVQVKQMAPLPLVKFWSFWEN